MTRLEAFLKFNEEIDFPDDILLLKEHIKEIRDIPNSAIQRLYREWSNDYFCAGWLIIDIHQIQAFRDWLLEDKNE